jgi:hypothetical protein
MARDDMKPPQDSSESMVERRCVEECARLEGDHEQAVQPPRVFKQPWMDRNGVVPRK